jgi:hypothetical protein
VIARLEPAPPVYDPGGPACTIDDFGADNVTTARELLVGVRRWATKRGATQLVMIAAHGDATTRALLKDEGLTLASEWWVQTPPLTTGETLLFTPPPHVDADGQDGRDDQSRDTTPIDGGPRHVTLTFPPRIGPPFGPTFLWGRR